MKKLTLAFALLLIASAGAYAQTTPAGTQYPPGSTEIYPKKIKDPVQLDEAHIANSRARSGYSAREADASRYNKPPIFKVEIMVTNRAAKTIKSVEWTVTLTDPNTGDVISTYDVTNKAKISPGKSKKLSQTLRNPQARVVRATDPTPSQPRVGNIKVAVKNVTYADGTTSTTP